MADPSASVMSFMLSWLTPTSLFLILNLTIITIVLSHHFHNYPAHHHQHLDDHQLGLFNSQQLARSSSLLLNRVRSFNFSHYKFQQPDPQPEYTTPDNPSGLVRTPDQESESTMQYPIQDNPTGLIRTPSLLTRFSSFYKPENSDPEPEHVMPHPALDNPTGIVRTPSLLARLKSMDFSSLYRPEQPDPESKNLDPKEPRDSDPQQDHLVNRSKSDKGVGAPRNRPEKAIKKTGSEKSEENKDAVGPRRRMVEKTMSFGDDEEGVDAKADDFINRFKQQLKLQRLDSLLRYKEMLKRN